MITVEDYRARIRGLLRETGVETIGLADAAGRVVAVPVSSPEQLPSFDNSAMDGYAVRAADVSAPPATLPVAGDIPAGAPVGDLAPGTALRIMTGAPLPRGADTVVEVEVTDGGTEQVTIGEAREVGRFVRPAGSDVAIGQEILPAGVTLDAAQIGLLAALGITEVDVRRQPHVLVVSTGSELAEDPDPAAGQIRDSNSWLLAVAAEQAGATATRLRWVADDVPAFLAALESAIDEHGPDLIITSGGVSAGAYEVVKDALTPAGISFTKVAMQPGMPQGSGTFGAVPVVCLPGNPVSALTSFEVFVRPALRASFGHPRPDRPPVTAVLTETVTKPAGKRQFRRGRLDAATGTVTPWGPPGSGFLGWFAGADCLIDLPADVAEVEAGAQVTVQSVTT